MAVLDLALLKSKLLIDGSEQDALLEVLIEQSKDIVSKEYFGYADIPEQWVFPESFTYVGLEVATYLYNKVGIEGQVSHKEQGIERVYAEGGVPRHLFDQLPRKVKAFSL